MTKKLYINRKKLTIYKSYEKYCQVGYEASFYQ